MSERLFKATMPKSWETSMTCPINDVIDRLALFYLTAPLHKYPYD